MAAKAGDYITDGSVRWIVVDTRDGCLVGGVLLSYVLPKGYVKANGAVVNRDDYPRLVQFAEENNLWDDDNDGLYGTGDGETTFRLPDLMGRFVESADAAGALTEAGLPNITGRNASSLGYYNSTPTPGSSEASNISGVFYGTATSTVSVSTRNGTGADSYFTNMKIDASRSSSVYGSSTSVQPPSISLIPCIKY